MDAIVKSLSGKPGFGWSRNKKISHCADGILESPRKKFIRRSKMILGLYTNISKYWSGWKFLRWRFKPEVLLLVIFITTFLVTQSRQFPYFKPWFPVIIKYLANLLLFFPGTGIGTGSIISFPLKFILKGSLALLFIEMEK